MASLKIRSRKDGAAVAMDDTDRGLLNLLQGSFPLDPRPYAKVAAAIELTEDEVVQRVDRLVKERIIRQVTPIYDTRALGYASMLVAAKVDPENPWRPAKVVNAHPGVSHNYLRNHEFNLWFTIATEPDSELGLEGTLQALAEEAGAESVRQLPTLKLFKIRMDLEMVKGTEALATAAVATEPAETERQPYDETDIAVIRATQGDMPIVAEPFAPAAAELGWDVPKLLEHLEGMRERRLLRRVAAILFHRRAGFSANGMGVWKVPDDKILEIGGAHGVLPRDLPLLPAAHLRRLALLRLHDGPRAIQGGVRRDPRRDRRGHGHPRALDALLVDGVQEDPPPVLHRRVQGVGAGALLNDARSAALYRRAVEVMPGGVNSPVRAMGSIGRDPIFVERGEGAEIVDVDGNRYVDYVCSWGPLIAGHAHPEIVAAVVAAARNGTTFGAPTAGEVELAAEVRRRIPSVELLRMTSSGTEASMSAIRLARAVTGREKLLKFAGHYHGHVDGLLAEAGSGLATQGIPASPGVPVAQAAETVIVPWNDEVALREAVERHEFAAILAEPIPANMGLVPPSDGFLQLLRELADANGALFVLDEVITGFRVGRGGAQELAGVEPDLTILGKVIGGGLPAAAYGGRARADGAHRARRRRLPGRDAVREPAGRRRGPGHALAARRARPTTA